VFGLALGQPRVMSFKGQRREVGVDLSEEYLDGEGLG
jgi:hypothetical protein